MFLFEFAPLVAVSGGTGEGAFWFLPLLLRDLTPISVGHEPFWQVFSCGGFYLKKFTNPDAIEGYRSVLTRE
jgi:hypothetical protein